MVSLWLRLSNTFSQPLKATTAAPCSVPSNNLRRVSLGSGLDILFFLRVPSTVEPAPSASGKASVAPSLEINGNIGYAYQIDYLLRRWIFGLQSFGDIGSDLASGAVVAFGEWKLFLCTNRSSWNACY